ncbi:MAG TPA: hypothetical protein VF329_09690 [Gammaproteobacteria bacterium]
MASAFPGDVSASESAPVSIDAGALAHLRYIRDTMEAAHTFTSVPGKGCIAMGLTALMAAVLDSIPNLTPYWLPIWLAAAVAAVGLASYFFVQKARAQGLSLWRGVARRFFLTLLPALVAGAVLTGALIDSDARDLVAGSWLLLYGAGLAASGVFSIRPVMLAGFGFMALGTLAFLLPPEWTTALLALGFGGFHVVLGVIILRRHGG